MSQFNFGNLESPLSGEDFINDNLEPWRDALHSNHSGSSRPAYAVAGMMWLDTTTNPWNIKFFTGSADISIGTLNTSSNLYTPAGYTISAYIQTLLDDANASTARATLGLAIGTDVQAFNSVLALLAGLTPAADKGIYFTGAGAVTTFTLTTAGRALLDDADVAAQWVTLGLGTAAGLDYGTSANQLVQLTAAGKYPAIDGSLITNVASDGVTIYDGAFAGGAASEDFTWTAGAYKRLKIFINDLSVTGSGSVNINGYMRFLNNGSVNSSTNNYHNWFEDLNTTTNTLSYDYGDLGTASQQIPIAFNGTTGLGVGVSNGTGYSADIEITNLLTYPMVQGKIKATGVHTRMARLTALTSVNTTLFSGIRIGVLVSSSSRVLSTTSKMLIKGYP